MVSKNPSEFIANSMFPQNQGWEWVEGIMGGRGPSTIEEVFIQ